MISFRLLGVLLLLGVGVGLGVALAAYERRRCRQAEGFLELLRHIRMQIDCFSLSVPRILSRCDGRILTDCGVECEKLTDFVTLLRGTRLYVPEEFGRLLWDFAERLGGSYREDQLRCCDYFLERLIPQCDRLRNELPRRERMLLLLPIAFAAMLALLLL
ncbi:MAG: hypothetical protein IKM08_04195 [Clostridia bacterium]|nr:hypothetical protein [Clostridia bacterium]